MTGPKVIVVMGVSGSGKTTIGQMLAARIGGRFADADGFHPRSNVEKMQRGIPLNDDDRWPWLDAMSDAIGDWLSREAPAVLACSALKRSYRDRLRAGRPGIFFVHLAGNERVIAERMAARTGHFMPVSLLHSQMQTLEPLEADEDGITLDARLPPGRLVDELVADLAIS